MCYRKSIAFVLQKARLQNTVTIDACTHLWQNSVMNYINMQEDNSY